MVISQSIDRGFHCSPLEAAQHRNKVLFVNCHRDRHNGWFLGGCVVKSCSLRHRQSPRCPWPETLSPDASSFRGPPGRAYSCTFLPPLRPPFVIWRVLSGVEPYSSPFFRCQDLRGVGSGWICRPRTRACCVSSFAEESMCWKYRVAFFFKQP